MLKPNTSSHATQAANQTFNQTSTKTVQNNIMFGLHAARRFQTQQAHPMKTTQILTPAHQNASEATRTAAPTVEQLEQDKHVQCTHNGSTRAWPRKACQYMPTRSVSQHSPGSWQSWRPIEHLACTCRWHKMKLNIVPTLLSKRFLLGKREVKLCCIRTIDCDMRRVCTLKTGTDHMKRGQIARHPACQVRASVQATDAYHICKRPPGQHQLHNMRPVPFLADLEGTWYHTRKRFLQAQRCSSPKWWTLWWN